MTSKCKLSAAIALLALATGLAGCANSPYLARTETITLGAGDAVARNRAIHTINPRPAHAYRTHIHTDGRRMENAMERYHDPGKSADGDGESDTQSSTDNQGPRGLNPQ